MKIIYIIILLSQLICLTCFSQVADDIQKESPQISIGYISTIKHPGVSLGFHQNYKSSFIEKEKRNNKVKNFYAAKGIYAKLNWYHHVDYHDNLFLSLGWEYSRTKTNGLFNNFSVGVGLSRTFNGATTYEVNSDNSISIDKNAGYYYTLLDAAYTIGYDFEKTKNKPYLLFSRISIITMVPYNSTIYMRPLIAFGVAFKLINK